MNNANFLAKENFPQSTYTFDFLQNMIKMAGSLALLGGDHFILSGCADDGKGVISEGLIVINGQLYPFAGGAKKAKIKIQETGESDHYAGVDYPEAYIHRKVIFADDGGILWDDLKQVLTNKDLENKINSLRGEAPGFVKMWSGLPERLGKEYLLCDGSTVNTAEYPDLAYFYGKEGESSFKLPDLRQRFVVGYDNGVADYNEIGKQGGEKEHILTIDEMPEHNHIMPWGENVNQEWNPPWGYAEDYLTGRRGSNSNDSDNAFAWSSPSGKGKAHENRPPYYVLAFVVRVKY